MTKDKPINAIPFPKKVIIPLQQHTGKICEPVVKVGDEVTAGQKIGESTGYISAPIHASISGKVTGIEDQPHPLAVAVPAIIIEQTETSKDTVWKEKRDWIGLSAQEIRDIIKNAGIVGLGGAAFPTYVKLSPPEGKKIDALVINGVECEPFLTTDHRLMLEKTDEIITGIKIILKVLNIKNAYIGIEKNKPDAIALFREKLGNESAGSGTEIKVIPLKVKYPQGAEKQLIKAILNREVPSGGLPFDIGVVVQNVGTTFAVYEAVAYGKPLIERVITVTGDGIGKPQNILVRIGTRLEDVIILSGGLTITGLTSNGLETNGSGYKIIMGGPMMGIAQYCLDIPVIKGTSGILVLKESIKKPTKPCIKCGQCVDHCPMGLMPNRLEDFAERDDFDSCLDYNIRDCIECGVCTFICPSARPIVHYIKYAKWNIARKPK